MKKFTIINGVQTLGILLIVFAAVGGLTLDTTNQKSSVLSDKTMSVNMIVSYGEKTLKEMPYSTNGFPDFNGGAAAFRIEIDPVAPAGSTVTVTTTEDCVLFSDNTGGGIYGQSKTDSINALYILAVGAVDDQEYEGEHNCKVTASFTSTSKELNGQSRYITFTIADNDEKPAEEIASELESTSTKPEVPVTKLLNSEGEEIESDTELAKFAENETITISGTTVANGEVNLYIFSEPQEASVVANNEGAWSYTIEDIEPGTHHVEAEVTDPATGATSDRTQVLAFEVVQSEASAQEEIPESVAPISEESSSSQLGLILAVGTSVLLLALGLGGLILYRKKHPHHAEDYNSTETITPSDGMGSGL